MISFEQSLRNGKAGFEVSHFFKTFEVNFQIALQKGLANPVVLSFVHLSYVTTLSSE
jgi:hypothetical protein